ncbi:hypothetical protein Tco_1215628, partial [Tanacetum coccineum]
AQRENQQANELSNLTRQRQLLASVNYRRAIIEELEGLPGNLVACKTTEHLKRIQKAVFVEVIELKKELRLQREVQLTTEINNLIRQLLDIIDERCSFIGELEQRFLTNVMAYKTRQELKCHQKDDMIKAMGLEVGSIRRIQGIGYGVLEFLGVGTTFNIFQNIHILYLEYGVLIFFWIRRIELVSFVVFGECRRGYAVSSLMDTAYW